VHEARWVGIEEAIALLTFESEQKIVEHAHAILRQRP
jgi:hypothetical protein